MGASGHYQAFARLLVDGARTLINSGNDGAPEGEFPMLAEAMAISSSSDASVEPNATRCLAVLVQREHSRRMLNIAEVSAQVARFRAPPAPGMPNGDAAVAMPWCSAPGRPAAAALQVKLAGLPLAKQLSLFESASVLVATSGTALHNVVLMQVRWHRGALRLLGVCPSLPAVPTLAWICGSGDHAPWLVFSALDVLQPSNCRRHVCGGGVSRTAWPPLPHAYSVGSGLVGGGTYGVCAQGVHRPPRIHYSVCFQGRWDTKNVDFAVDIATLQQALTTAGRLYAVLTNCATQPLC